MKILYLDPLHVYRPIKALLSRGGHQVTYIADDQKALAMLRSQTFSAVLIADEVRNPEKFHFISRVQQEHPELPVFPLSAWRSELVEMLDSLEAIRNQAAANLADA